MGAWPTDDLTSTHLDATTDDPDQARIELLALLQKVQALIAAAGDASGVCDLDASTLVPVSRLPTVTVPKGGTGVATLTQYGVVIGNGTGAVTVAGVGTAGQVLTSNGAGSAPTMQAVDVDTLYADVAPTNNLSVGYPTDIEGMGNSGTGTQTPDFEKEGIKTLTVNGSFTLGEPAKTGACAIIVTNDATGGYAITTTGYETIGGGAYDNTANAKHLLIVMKEGSNSYLEWLNIA